VERTGQESPEDSDVSLSLLSDERLHCESDPRCRNAGKLFAENLRLCCCFETVCTYCIGGAAAAFAQFFDSE